MKAVVIGCCSATVGHHAHCSLLSRLSHSLGQSRSGGGLGSSSHAGCPHPVAGGGGGGFTSRVMVNTRPSTSPSMVVCLVCVSLSAVGSAVR